jgi:hypothetical protein
MVALPPRAPSIFVVTVSCVRSAVIAYVSVHFGPCSGAVTTSSRPSFHAALTFVVPPRERSSSDFLPSVVNRCSRPAPSTIVTSGSECRIVSVSSAAKAGDSAAPPESPAPSPDHRSRRAGRGLRGRAIRSIRPRSRACLERLRGIVR